MSSTMSTSKEAGSTLDRLLLDKLRATTGEQWIPMVSFESEEYMTMRIVCKSILSEDDWVKIVQTPEIRKRWFSAYSEKLKDLTVKAVFDKLDRLATLQPSDGIKVGSIDYVWFSDTAVDSATRESLKKLAFLLEKDPENRSDTVLYNDAYLLKPIDSLLYPFSREHSHVLAKPISSPKDALSIDTLGHNPGDLDDWKEFLAANYNKADGSDKSIYSLYYGIDEDTDPDLETCLRLPAEFSVNSSGGVTIESYINNLHPVDYSGFYPTIASAFSCLLPLFEQTLTDIAHFQCSRDIPVKDDLPLRPVTPYSLRGRRLQGITIFVKKEILATGIYCYDAENVTDGGMELREYLGTGGGWYDTPVSDPYDLFSQEVGIANIKPGRSMVYSNVYQSRDVGFRLCDPAKPGFRKTLIFYLVDPTLRVPSSEIVPPQQQNWWAREVKQIAPISELPDLIWDRILGYIDYPMSLKSARKERDYILNDDGALIQEELRDGIFSGYEVHRPRYDDTE